MKEMNIIPFAIVIKIDGPKVQQAKNLNAITII